MGLVEGSGMQAGRAAGVTAGNEAHAAPLELSQYEPRSMLHVHESRVHRSTFPPIDLYTHRLSYAHLRLDKIGERCGTLARSRIPGNSPRTARGDGPQEHSGYG